MAKSKHRFYRGKSGLKDLLIVFWKNQEIALFWCNSVGYKNDFDLVPLLA